MPIKSAHIITCEDCGWPYATVRGNTKVCFVCRTNRSIEFMAGKKEKCIVCGNSFLPLERWKPGMSKCGNCRLAPSVHDFAGTCTLCGTETAKLLHRDLACCRPCSTSPKRRDELVKRVVSKIRWRISHPPTEENVTREQAYLDDKAQTSGEKWIAEVLAEVPAESEPAI